MERLWTPWRHSYVGGQQRSGGDMFEALAADTNDEANLILLRGQLTFVIMNLFPYNAGHVMIVPYRRVADPADLTPEEWAEVGVLLRRVTAALRATLRPDGFNIGINVGAAAGAGLPDHVHLHIVPRWSGDTNFMPVLGSTKVLPELLPDTYARLRAALQADAESVAAAPGAAVPPAGVGVAATSALVSDSAPDTGASDHTPAVAALGAAAIMVGAGAAAGSGVAATESVTPAAAAILVGPAGEASSEAALSDAVAEAPPVAVDEPATTGEIEVAAETATAAAVMATAAEPEAPMADEVEAAVTPEPAPEAAALPVVPQAGAVVLVRDKVALRLAKDRTWVLPKGHIEPGETPEQAAVREVAEEMGLTGALGAFVDDLRFPYRGEERVVSYYILHADHRLPSWSEHFGRDTFLFSRQEAASRLSHADARAVLARALTLADRR